MKVTILEDGFGKDGKFIGGRFTIQLHSRWGSAPPSFSEMPSGGNSKIFFREFGKASLEEVQGILASWIREENRPDIKATELVKGATVRTSGEVKVRVKSPKK